nr:glycosyltransferase family 4 protein [Oculatella sp. LEGE 06141]
MSTSDISGGAARAAYRLHQGLQRASVDSKMLVQFKSSDDATVIAPRSSLSDAIAKLRVAVNALPPKLYSRQPETLFSTQWLPDTVLPAVKRLQPDVVNLHWIAAGFTRIETIAKFKQPVVWSLHDMWAFTGGCHYDDGCDRYRQSCGSCPQLNSQTNWDLSRWTWQRKANAWRNTNLTIVGLSHWLAKCAHSSPLFHDQRIEVIPNGIDTDVYQPLDRQFARSVLKLPQDKRLVLFASMFATSDQRKGFQFLQPALQELSQSGWHDQLELVIMGASRPQQPPDLGFKSHYLGTLSDDLLLALVYSAADVFVLPSTQENLANTVMEAIACGVPCVTFNIGGMPDMIEHQQNGYLAQPYQVEDLARGIAWVLEDETRHQTLRYRAREKTEQEFTLDIQAQRYQSLFAELIEEQRSPPSKI